MDRAALYELVKDMPSYIIDGDYDIYAKYLPLLPGGSKVIDLGTGWGKSAVIMGAANPCATIHTLDDGSYPISKGWAASHEDYYNRIYDEFQKHGVGNAIILKGNALTYETDEAYEMLHMDFVQEYETMVLEKWLHRLKKNGFALVRNYLRFKDAADKLLQGYTYLDYGGLIQVVQK